MSAAKRALLGRFEADEPAPAYKGAVQERAILGGRLGDAPAPVPPASGGVLFNIKGSGQYLCSQERFTLFSGVRTKAVEGGMCKETPSCKGPEIKRSHTRTPSYRP